MNKKPWIFLMMVMCLALMVVQPASAAFPKSDGGYYWLDTNRYGDEGVPFIKAIGMSGHKSSSTALGEVTTMVMGPNGSAVLDYDLNAAADGDYIYIGWSYTYDPTDAITGLQARIFSRDEIDEDVGPDRSYENSGVTWYLANSGCHEWAPKLNSDQSEEGYLDLNDGAGGDYVYLYVTKDPNYGPPLSGISASQLVGSNSTHFSDVCDENGNPADFNSETDATPVYLTMETKLVASNILKMKQLIDKADTFLFQGAENAYSGLGTLRTVRNDAFDNTWNTWLSGRLNANSDKFSKGTQVALSNDTISGKIRVLEGNLNDLKAKVYFNATANGGGANQTKEYSLGENPTVDTKAQVNLGQVSASKNGYEFVGWDTSKTSTLGFKTGTVSVKPGTTYYAIFKKNLTANFHYLDTDGNTTHSTATATIYNNDATAQYTIPSVPEEFTVNGVEYTLKGWRADLQAAEQEYATEGQLTLNSDVTNLYAVYEAEIELCFKMGEVGSNVRVINRIIVNVSGQKTSATFTPQFTLNNVPEGHTFVGWATSEGGEVKYPEGTAITSQENMTLYPVYQPDHTVSIFGTAQYGQQLTAHYQGPADATSARYQWYRDGLSIADETESTYTIVKEDVGCELIVKCTIGDTTINSNAVLVGKATVTLTNPQNPSKVYDGTTAISFEDGNKGSLSGIVNGDAVTYDLTGVFDNKDVGNYKDLTLSAALTGDWNQYYDLTMVGMSFGSITPAPLTPVIVDSTTNAAPTGAVEKTYDGTTEATGLAIKLDGIVASDDVSIDGSTFAYNSKDVATADTITASLGTLSGADAGNYTLQEPQEPLTVSGTIDKRIVTASIIGTLTKPYDGTTDVRDDVALKLDGLVDGETTTITAEFSYDDINASDSRPIVAHGLEWDQTTPVYQNYTLASSQITATGSITKVTPTIEFASHYTPSKDYDSEPATTPTKNDLVLTNWYGTFDQVSFEWAPVDDPSTTSATPPTDAGSYMLTVKLPDTVNTNAASASMQVEISKARPNIDFTNFKDTYTYDGNPIPNPTPNEITVGVVKYDELNFAWEDDNGNALSANPSAVGAYKLIISASETNNHYGLNETVGITIQPRAAGQPIIELNPASFLYDGTAKTPAVTLKDAQGQVLPASTYEAQYLNNVNVGTATVKITSTSYTFSQVPTAEFVIEKAEAAFAVEPAAIAGLVYSGSAQTLLSEGSAAKDAAGQLCGEVLYSLDGETYTASLPTGTDAGAYTFYAKVKGNANHHDSAPLTLQASIGKAPAPVLTWPTAGSLTYGQPLADSSLTGGSVGYGAFAWTNPELIPTADVTAANLTFTPSAATLQNYQPIETAKDVALIVAKADTTLALALESISPNGDGTCTVVLSASAARSGEGTWPTGTVAFAADQAAIGSAQLDAATGNVTLTWPSATINMLYAVTAAYQGDTNYKPADSAALTVDTNRQMQADLSIPHPGEKTYGDAAFELSITGGSGTGAVSFTSSDEEILTISGTTAAIRRAGTVTITAQKAADNDYNGASATLELTIGKKALTVRAESYQIYVGDALPAVFGYAVDGLVEADTFTNPSLSTTADANTAGTYNILISGGTLSKADCYELTYQPGTLRVVEKMPPVINNATDAPTITVDEGGKATLVVEAENAVSYQWYIDRNDGQGFVAIPGATSATYTADAAQPESDGFRFYCVVTGAPGTQPATSQVFTLDVKPVTPPQKNDYMIIVGANQVVTQGNPALFTSNAPFKTFVEVRVDGNVVAPSNYTKKEGSIQITLTAEYMSTLSVGEHVLSIVSNDGEANTKFWVQSQAVTTQPPKTGDDSRVGLWTAMLLLSLAGLCTLRRKRRMD